MSFENKCYNAVSSWSGGPSVLSEEHSNTEFLYGFLQFLFP